ncbi:hypothetical protein ElyMa_000269800 [Elysia marginata]|uniref:Uncharacterized protein n=1 Tax=Elysia marginata TaxID=1093978 RepID=A0AAV4F4I0_9GAST|nr:hypothetical protein ElyMa_000269800 [Elysia marginata]
MPVLPLDHSEVYERFCSGQYFIRRSDRFWAGLSPDLVIEQVLMRSFKSAGGLTSGRGFEVSSRTQWLLSMPACSEINCVMQELTDAQYGNIEQHKESTDIRQSRDNKDIEAILQFLISRNPFGTDTSL